MKKKFLYTFIIDLFFVLELEVYFLISFLTEDDILVSGDNCRIIVETNKIRQEKLMSKYEDNLILIKLK